MVDWLGLNNQYDYLHEFSTNEVNSNEKKTNPWELTKPFKNNMFLKMLLSEKNAQWRLELISKLQTSNTKVTVDSEGLSVSTTSQMGAYKNWCIVMNAIISAYFEEFKYETISYEASKKDDILKLTQQIEEIRKIYLMDFELIENKLQLYVISRKNHFDDFFLRNPNFNKLRNGQKNDSSIVNKRHDLPKNNFHTFNSVVVSALPILIKKFNIQEFNLNTDEFYIHLTGYTSNVESLIECINKSISSIRCKKIDFLNDKNIIQAKNLNCIIKDILSKCNLNLIYKIHIQAGDDEHENGVFVTYFQNCPQLDSSDNSVFLVIYNYLRDKISHMEIDVNQYEKILLNPEWKKFEMEYLQDVNNFSYSKITNKDGDIKILLTGKSEILLPVKFQIEEFFNANQTEQIQFPLNQENVKF